MALKLDNHDGNISLDDIHQLEKKFNVFLKRATLNFCCKQMDVIILVLMKV